MNGILKFVLILNVFGAIVCELKNVTDLGDGEDCKDQVYGNRTEDSSNPGPSAKLTPTVYQNVKRYYCALENVDQGNVNTQNIIFATNEWRFPLQDVNLTLSYPTSDGERDYIITSMEVYLFFDGNTHSKGYITDGGMNQDFISLEFIIPETRSLYYQFRLDGIPKTSPNQETFLEYDYTNICN